MFGLILTLTQSQKSENNNIAEYKLGLTSGSLIENFGHEIPIVPTTKKGKSTVNTLHVTYTGDALYLKFTETRSMQSPRETPKSTGKALFNYKVHRKSRSHKVRGKRRSYKVHRKALHTKSTEKALHIKSMEKLFILSPWKSHSYKVHGKALHM